MSAVTRLDGCTVPLNDDLIESIEQTPDTVLSLINGHKIMARDKPADLMQRVVDFKRLLQRDDAPHTMESPR